MYKGIIKDFVVRGRVFHIVQDEEGFFLAVEDKYVTNGKLNTTLNGFQLHASKCLKTCLQGVEDMVEIDYLRSIGKSDAEAFSIVANVPLEMCINLF